MNAQQKQYGILLIGCGHIGCQHLNDIYYRDDIKIVAVVDTFIDRAQNAAKRYNVKKFGNNYLEFLDDPEIDIVIIATYADTHLSIATKCINHGKHVLCEKPIASNQADGDAFIELIKKSPVKVQIAHILRHNASYQKVRSIINSGKIGQLRLVRMVQNHHAINWDRYSRLLKDCIPAVDCGIHYYDVLRWFTGAEFVKISGFGCKIDVDAPNLNYNVVNFSLSNGCVGYYEAGWSKNLPAQTTKEFIGTKGRIKLIMQYQRSENWADGDVIEIYNNNSNEYININVQSEYKNMYAQLKSLINCIETDTEPIPSTDDIKKAFDISMAAEKAILTGNTIYL